MANNQEGIAIEKNKITVTHINVRQSISLLILRLILIDIISAVLFISFHSLLFNTGISRTLNLNPDFYYIILFLILIIAKISLTVYLVLEWLSEYYEITPEAIIHRKGFVFKNIDKRSLDKVRYINLIRGPVAGILNYGTLRLFDIRLNKYMDLYLIHNPIRYMHILEDLLPNLEEKKEFFIERGLENTEKE